jgi:hypothetical protein
MIPCRKFQHRFAHEASPQHVSYGDGDFIEMTGTRARTWSATIAFNETLKNYDQLFSKTYPEFYTAYRDRSPGTLVTPLHGPVLCKPGSYEDDLNPMVLDGISVDVIFTEHTPVKGSQLDAPPNLQSLFTEAMSLADHGTGPDFQSPDVKPKLDALTAIAASINKVNTARDKVRGNILRISNQANAIETALAKVGANGGPKLTSARMQARRLRLRSEQLANSPPREAAGVVTQEVTSAPTTVMQLARDLKMDLKDFLELNVALAKAVIVPPGTRIWRSK